MKQRDLSFMAIFLPLYYLAFYMCRYSVLPVGPILTEKMKLSTGAYGLSLSALFTGYAFMLMPAGIIARKWGAKKAILAGAAGTIAANFFLLITASPYTLFVALFLNGASQGLIWPSLMQIVALNVKGVAANWIVGLMMTSAILGPGFTFMIGGLLIFLDIWWAIFILSSLQLVVLTVYFYKANIKSEIPVHSIKFKWP
ncbi:MAG TPA: MFS transporter [Thermofilum sp.]|nr:MFS transporter [Thermofilum sp.]